MNRNAAILLAVFVAVLFVVVWKTRPRPAPSAPLAALPASPSDSVPMPLVPEIASREKRAELRRKILEAWASGEQGEEAAKEARRGRFEEHPDKDGEGIDPAYVQAAMREQLVPMAKACFEELLSRDPKASGRIDMRFKIVADDQLGGIVDEDDDRDGGMISGTLADERFQTCIRESLLTVTFPPPAHGGVVTVGYPIVISQGQPPDEEDAK